MDGFITFYELTPASIKPVWQFREWKKVKYTIDDGDLILYEYLMGEKERRLQLRDVSQIPIR